MNNRKNDFVFVLSFQESTDNGDVHIMELVTEEYSRIRCYCQAKARLPLVGSVVNCWSCVILVTCFFWGCSLGLGLCCLGEYRFFFFSNLPLPRSISSTNFICLNIASRVWRRKIQDKDAFALLLQTFS